MTAWIDERPPLTMPSYEHELGRLVVCDVLVCARTGDQVMMFSRWWHTATILAPDTMVPLHHGQEAWWEWRPCVYRWTTFIGDIVLDTGYWQTLGSQAELTWRSGLAAVRSAMLDAAEQGGDWHAFVDREQAEQRAEQLLIENLSPQQRIEYAATGAFRCRGGWTRNVYRVNPGEGFDLLDETRDRVLRDYCLHTEDWLPGHDQALAMKFALEDPELEVAVLERARGYGRDPTLTRRRTAEDMIAAAIETRHELLPRRRELVSA